MTHRNMTFHTISLCGLCLFLCMNIHFLNVISSCWCWCWCRYKHNALTKESKTIFAEEKIADRNRQCRRENWFFISVGKRLRTPHSTFHSTTHLCRNKMRPTLSWWLFLSFEARVKNRKRSMSNIFMNMIKKYDEVADNILWLWFSFFSFSSVVTSGLIGYKKQQRTIRKRKILKIEISSE